MNTPRSGARRWPLHPPPGPIEALSSWLARLARLYGLSVTDLLRHNLGPASAQVTESVLADLDFDPPASVLAALTQRTGVELAQLQMMTLAGWVPWLTDTLATLDTDAAQELFDTYVRQHSVLLVTGEAGDNVVHRWRGPWLGTVQPTPWPIRRACPLCAADPNSGAALTWRLPIMASCAWHACRLEPELEVEIAVARHTPMRPTPVSEHVASLDRRTHEALMTGQVTLPGRSVHVGVWFRLLRTLLDELSIAPSRVGVQSRPTLEHIWSVTGEPVRAGLTVWRPYEQLDWPRQETMLHAAAIALHLVETGAITARGTLGTALTAQSHRQVYDGEEQAYRLRKAWNELNAMVVAARTDRDTARRFLSWFPPPADWVRRILLDHGVPAEFLTPTEPATRAAPSDHISGPQDRSRDIDFVTG